MKGKPRTVTTKVPRYNFPIWFDFFLGEDARSCFAIMSILPREPRFDTISRWSLNWKTNSSHLGKTELFEKVNFLGNQDPKNVMLRYKYALPFARRIQEEALAK